MLRTLGRTRTFISSSVRLTDPSGSGTPTANPNCDPNGLVMAPFTFVNTDALDRRTRLRVTSSDRTRTTCVSISVNPQVASGSIDSASFDGSTASLPTSLAGQRNRIDVSGTYINR